MFTEVARSPAIDLLSLGLVEVPGTVYKVAPCTANFQWGTIQTAPNCLYGISMWGEEYSRAHM